MNPFLDACGASGSLLLGVETPGAEASDTRALDQPFVLLGRDARCDLRLDHHEVSDRHAYLQLVGGRLVCIDLGSRNGIMVGGRRSRLIDIERGKPVRIGPFRVRLLAGDLDTAVTPHHWVEAGGPTLELSHRSLRQSRCDLPPGLALVGSGVDCQIRLIDPSLSTYHCSLVHTRHGIWVVDLLGQGGARVNGQEVGYARLYDGDVVQVGHSEIRLTLSGAGEGSAFEGPERAVQNEVDSLGSSTTKETALGVLRATGALHSTTSEVGSPRLAAEPKPMPAFPVSAMSEGDGGVMIPAAQAAEIVERVLSPMLNQYGLMQQRMVEDFHQARHMMFDVIATLQQEQSAFLSQELEQLRQLSRELNSLRDELQRQTEGPSAGVVAHASPEPVFQPERLVAANLPKSNEAARVSRPVVNTLARERVDAPDATADANRPESARRTGQDESTHAQLCERIARIQDEHQSRWKTLFGLFPSALPGKPTG